MSVLADAYPSVFDPTTVLEMIEGQQRGYSNPERLFALVMFGLWRRDIP